MNQTVERHAARYYVKFNVKMSQVIINIYSAKKPLNWNITVNDKMVDIVQSVTHLGHLMTDNMILTYPSVLVISTEKYNMI